MLPKDNQLQVGMVSENLTNYLKESRFDEESKTKNEKEKIKCTSWL